MKLFVSLVYVFSFFIGLAQQEVNFEKIDSIGKEFNYNLRNANIEPLRNIKPVKGTWTFQRLSEYKKEFTENYESLFFVTIIEPSLTKEDMYGYNLCVYKKIKPKEYEYYFAAIVSVDTSSEEYKVYNSFLFTEEEAIKSWWRHIFGMYYEEKLNEIPEKYNLKFPPPPPFKE